MGIVFQSLLNNTAYLHRLERTPDGQGGYKISFVANGTQAARIRPATSREQTIALSEERRITHVLYVVAGADIRRGDMATIDQLTVEIQGIREPSQAAEHWEIDCLERQQETEILDYLVTESGDYLVTESGDFMVLE